MLARPEAPTAASIAASVQKSKALVEAEAALERCRAAVAAHGEELTALIARNTNNRLDEKIAAHCAESAPFTEAVRAARAVCMPLRAAHGEAVAKALDPYRADAATRLLYALEAAREALHAIDETQVLIERAGGERPRLAMPYLDQLEHAARRLGGRTQR